MICPRCGAASSVLDTRPSDFRTTRRRRECMNLHKFTTIEIPAAAYGSVKQRLAVLARTTAGRIATFKRDRQIARELPSGWTQLAVRFNLTKSAIYLAAKRGRNA